MRVLKNRNPEKGHRRFLHSGLKNSWLQLGRSIIIFVRHQLRKRTTSQYARSGVPFLENATPLQLSSQPPQHNGFVFNSNTVRFRTATYLHSDSTLRTRLQHGADPTSTKLKVPTVDAAGASRRLVPSLELIFVRENITEEADNVVWCSTYDVVFNRGKYASHYCISCAKALATLDPVNTSQALPTARPAANRGGNHVSGKLQLLDLPEIRSTSRDRSASRLAPAHGSGSSRCRILHHVVVCSRKWLFFDKAYIQTVHFAVASACDASYWYCPSLFVPELQHGEQFLIDTGSSISTLPVRSKKSSDSYGNRSFAANGTRIATHGLPVQRIDLVFDGLLWSSHSRHSHHLGIDFLKHFSLSLTFRAVLLAMTPTAHTNAAGCQLLAFGIRHHRKSSLRLHTRLA
ncbi:hypothetical protein TYRP_006269 [Tyrophagus putrescentiae]|nr:hypothetical protein TYRP_006269 [Tyrophagus putrescentiae]